MQKKLMTSVKLEKNLHKQLQRQIIEDGYGMRGKSKWIIESIEALLTLADYPTLVDIADEIHHSSDIVTIRLPEKLMLQLEKAVVHVRKQYPTIEGVKSNLIRASIIQRLLRQGTSVTEA